MNHAVDVPKPSTLSVGLPVRVRLPVRARTQTGEYRQRIEYLRSSAVKRRF